MKQVVLALLVIFVAAAASACDSEPCEEAAAKLERCLKRLDNCRDADPMDRPKCTTALEEGTKAVDDFRSLPCAAQLSDKAEEINSCPVEQMPFCNCFAL